jgi:hypothetical protein
MRTLGSILALLLILFGLVVAAVVVVRIWQDNGRVQVNDVAVAADGAGGTSAQRSVGGDLSASGDLTAAGGEPLLLGVESGGMALATAAPQALLIPVAPQDEPVATLPALVEPAPVPTVDPCPPAPVAGFAADTAVVAVGMLRIYSQADVSAQTLGELNAGQGLWIVAAGDSTTAVKRCEITWHRVRTSDGIAGWVLDDAIGLVTPTVLPTLVPLPSALPTLSPCVGGCPTPCVQPCPQPDPCYQPCPQPTPCYQPCPQPAPCYEPCGGLG